MKRVIFEYTYWIIIETVKKETMTDNCMNFFITLQML